MKKLLVLILLSISIFASAEIVTGVTTGGQVYSGSGWEPIEGLDGVPVTINEGMISIYSSKPQYFNIMEASDFHTNSSGHEEITIEARDQYGARCKIRLVMRDDLDDPRAYLQIYVHYNNIDYVYDVREY